MADEVDLTCPWKERGEPCGKPGSMSDDTLGKGPWWCSEHYWKLKGLPVRSIPTKHISYRERWYAEHKMDYEPAKLGDIGNWKSVGTIKPMREPGEDDE